MSSDDALSVRPSNSSDDDAIARLGGHAFALDPARICAAYELGGPRNGRVICDGPDVIGTSLLLPMGQYFGQRRVSMAGIALVAVEPHYQRQGVASTLLRSMLREQAEEGMGLSTLFVTTKALYRKLGYADAGTRFRAIVDPRHLSADERSGTLLPMDAAGETRVRALYGAHAPAYAGFLDRSEYVWTRILRPWSGRTPTCVLARHDNGQVEGYVSYSKSPTPSGSHEIVVHDMFASSPWGYRRLWSFLGSSCTRLVDGVVLYTAPHDPAYMLLPEQRADVRLADTWMIRLLDLDAAFGQRGYPPRLEATLDIDVYDDVIDENNGQWRLSVSGGRGAIRRGGAGDLRTDIRGLSALYSGFAGPGALAASGLIEGTPAALAIAGTVFGAAQPWMREMF
ncbi:MAG: enhanced intracellular survival protein Eis [Nannocystaceae bacterium]|nr:GNAT family N-acetyltransferase [bacterium]